MRQEELKVSMKKRLTDIHGKPFLRDAGMILRVFY